MLVIPDAAQRRSGTQRLCFAVLPDDAAHAMSPQPGQGVNMALLDARALRESESIAEALAIYQRQRRAHVGIYHFWSRWLTPLFQSERHFAARWRDWLFHPMSRTPGARGQMLRVLSGTRKGWLGRMALPEGFVEVLDAVARPRELESQKPRGNRVRGSGEIGDGVGSQALRPRH